MTFWSDAAKLATQAAEDVMAPRLRMPKPVKLEWDKNAYYQEQCPKNLLVLHHTDGRTSARASADYLEQSSIRTRTQGDSRGDKYSVAVAWWVDRDGTILEAFDDSCWGHHNGTGQFNAKRSVAIELENLGILFDIGGNLHNRYGEPLPRGRYEIYESPAPWRDSRFFEAYPKQMVESLICLVDDILTRHPGIPRRIPKDFFPEVPWSTAKLATFKGIISHIFSVGYIPKRYAKYDISDAFRPHFDTFCKELRLERV